MGLIQGGFPLPEQCFKLCQEKGIVYMYISEYNMVYICEYPCMSVPGWVGYR